MAQERRRIQVERERSQRLSRMREEMGDGAAADQGSSQQQHRDRSEPSPGQGGKARAGAETEATGNSTPILSEEEMDAKWAQFESQMQIAHASQQTIRCVPIVVLKPRSLHF